MNAPLDKLRKGNNECPTCRENWANEPNLPARNRLAEELIQKMAAEPNKKKRKYDEIDEKSESEQIENKRHVMQHLRQQQQQGQPGPTGQPGQADGAFGQPKPTMQSLKQLIPALKSPNFDTQQQKQQVMNILKANSDLMAAFFKHKNQRQQQQGGASGQQGSQQVATSSRAPVGPPRPPQPQQMQMHQPQQLLMQPHRTRPQYQQYHPRPPQPGQPQGQPITVQGQPSQPGQKNEVMLNVEHHFMDKGKVVKKVGSSGANTAVHTMY